VPVNEPIRSRQNLLVRRLFALKDKASDDLLLLEGARLVEEGLRAEVALIEVAVSPRLGESERGRELQRRLAARGIAARLLDERLLGQLSDVETHQGVLAIARRPRFDEATIVAGAAPLVVVLAGVQNPGNVGAVFRAAEAAGASGVYLTPGCADPLGPKALRGAMGSALRLPHVAGLAPEALAERLHARGLRSIATVKTGGRAHDAVDLTRPTVLWLGGEGAGLSQATIANSDERVTIPMAAAVESLNLAVAAGVLLFEAARQRRARQR